MDVETLSVIRRWALREQLSIREIARRTAISYHQTYEHVFQRLHFRPAGSVIVELGQRSPLGRWLRCEVSKPWP